MCIKNEPCSVSSSGGGGPDSDTECPSHPRTGGAVLIRTGGTGCLLHQRVDNHKVFLRKNGQLPGQLVHRAGQHQQQPPGQMMVVRARGNAGARTAVLGNGRLAGAAATAAASTSSAAAPGNDHHDGSGGHGRATFSSLSASSVSAVQAASSAGNPKPGYINIGPERII